MRKLILFFVVFTIAVNVKSQTTFPPAYEYKTDTAIWNLIPHSFWQILEDKTEKLTLNDVSKDPVQQQFHDSTKGIDSTAKVFWIRFELKNNTGTRSFISHDGAWPLADLYIADSTGIFKHYAGGSLRAIKDRDGLKFLSIIPDTLEPDETRVIYSRLENNKAGLPHNFSVGFYNTGLNINSFYVNSLEQGRNFFTLTNILEAFIVGLLFLSIFLNLIFYAIVKEKVYLYFSLFAFFLSVNRFYGSMASYFFWVNESGYNILDYLRYSWALIPFFLIQFLRYFLNTKKFLPIWDKIIFILGILNIIILILAYTISTPYNAKVVSVLPFLIIPLSLMVVLIISVVRNKKDTSIKLITIGALPFLLLQIIAMFTGSLLDVSFIQTYRSYEATVVSLLVIIFTLTLLLRFDKLRKENTEKTMENERLAFEKEAQKMEIIEQQKLELENKVDERTKELKKSLEELKATQSQLIQSEKMASLGELTAGIAHEIQNPLNFVNNFSEVSNELIDEMKAELATGNQQLATKIADDIKQNLEKINHHGKRADAIVKGMLQHSRASSGQKELTDINTLADEYLRLAYHGLRAKDKNFNAKFETNFDTSIPKINIVPQDIGRVILNLITNAFYAVNEKAKGSMPNAESYEPTVTVSTKKDGDKILIAVADNGNGVPEAIKEKIFQPFFTTKPAGQGTGLGLSLSYDIIKAHGGEIKVETKEGEGTVFTLLLS